MALSRFLPSPARLAGTALLTVLALSACEDDPAPPFAIEGTGAVEGLVFFDVSEDGLFDPADGDEALAGVNVAVQERGTGETFASGSAQSGTDGRFRVDGLPAGTHDLLIDTLSVPEGVSICQNPLQVTVILDQPRFAEVRGRPGCLITIAEAKELTLGEFAIVRGVVTSAPGQIEGSVTYIQDETAGSKIFSGSLEGQGIEVGDQIEIGAIAEAFSNDFNFENATVRQIIPDVGAPDPQLVTTAEIAASGSDYTDPIQGLFIRLEAAELTTAFGDGNLNIQNGLIDDGSGAVTIRIDDGVADRNSLNDLLSVGTCYDIVGFGANFNGTGQIFPRSLDDIEEVPCS